MIKVLLVDDEVAFTTNVSKLLSKRGCQVTVANDGKSAIQAVEENDFEVAVLDMKMPGMDGLATLKALKVRQPALTVIILTGHATVDTAIEGLHLGAFDYMTKPVGVSDLTERIEQAYRRTLIRKKFDKAQRS